MCAVLYVDAWRWRRWKDRVRRVYRFMGNECKVRMVAVDNANDSRGIGLCVHTNASRYLRALTMRTATATATATMQIHVHPQQDFWTRTLDSDRGGG